MTAIGVAVDCTICGRCKAPRGRDIAPAQAGDLCSWECPGYDLEPRASTLWPGEEEPREQCNDCGEVIVGAHGHCPAGLEADE
jgi:hypothetical protein